MLFDILLQRLGVGRGDLAFGGVLRIGCQHLEVTAVITATGTGYMRIENRITEFLT